MARINGEIIIAAPIEQVFDVVADERSSRVTQAAGRPVSALSPSDR